MRRIVFAFAMAAISLAASAQVYKWRDAAGNIQYGDHPPSGTKAERVGRGSAATPGQGTESSGEAASPAPAAPTQKSAAERTQESRKKQQEADEKRKKEEAVAQNTKVKEENCRRARQQLASLDAGGRQARVDEKGERIFLDDAQIEKERAGAQKSVDEWCQ